MDAVIIIGFLLAAAVVLWAVIVAVSGNSARWVRALYLVCFLVAATAAYFTTYCYVYYADANTRFHGWPVPVVVFQRDSPKDPWLDFVGPTTILAYPMNLILYALLPSIVALLLAHQFPSRIRPKVV